jgi:transposase-like protein
MIVFPIANMLDDHACLDWLSAYLHPDGFVRPHCGSQARRLFRRHAFFPGYRCRTCDGYYTLLTGTVFKKTRQRPATLLLLLRGISKGESTQLLAQDLQLSRKQLHTLRQRIQTNLAETAPMDVMEGTEFEADELYQNAGEKKYAPSGPGRSTTTPCRVPSG